MSEHTATPWTISEIRGRLILREEPGIADGSDSYTVAETKFHSLISPEEAAANAVLVVKAVNNHDALVKALEAAREYLESDVSDGFRPAERLTAEIDQVLGDVGGPTK